MRRQKSPSQRYGVQRQNEIEEKQIQSKILVMKQPGHTGNRQMRERQKENWLEEWSTVLEGLGCGFTIAGNGKLIPLCSRHAFGSVASLRQVLFHFELKKLLSVQEGCDVDRKSA